MSKNEKEFVAQPPAVQAKPAKDYYKRNLPHYQVEGRPSIISKVEYICQNPVRKASQKMLMTTPGFGGNGWKGRGRSNCQAKKAQPGAAVPHVLTL